MKLVKYFAHNILVLIGLVMIWRSVWYILDEIDILVFGQNHIVTTVGGIFLGLFILYIPDKNLKEISNL